MNDREKLIGLIHSTGTCLSTSIEDCEKCEYVNEIDCCAAVVTDYLIANGVTVQKHGWWEDYINIKGVVRCSECNDTYIYRAWLDEGKWHYCPNCGAKMQDA